MSTETHEVRLALCGRCQALRRTGQLPVELLLQQWDYGLGKRESPEEGSLFHQVLLACLGCGSTLHPERIPEHSYLGGPGAPRRMPDGSIVVSCSSCRRANVLESRRGQLVAVRLW